MNFEKRKLLFALYSYGFNKIFISVPISDIMIAVRKCKVCFNVKTNLDGKVHHLSIQISLYDLLQWKSAKTRKCFLEPPLKIKKSYYQTTPLSCASQVNRKVAVTIDYPRLKMGWPGWGFIEIFITLKYKKWPHVAKWSCHPFLISFVRER